MRRLVPFTLCALALAGCSDALVSPEGGADPGDADTPGLTLKTRAFTPDAQQPTVDLTRGLTYAIYPRGEGQILSQTFSPTRNGRLGFIEVPVGCAPGVALEVTIREGLGGPVMYTVSRPLPPIVDGTFQLFQVYDPAISFGLKVKKNRTYAIELSASPADPKAVERTCGMAPGPAGDSYSDGQGFYEDVPTNGPGWLPLPNGAPADDEDLPFVILVL